MQPEKKIPNNKVGRVSALWRYPVKSMKGDELEQALLAFDGVLGDRRYAFHSSRSRPEFPYFTAREQPAMLLYRPIWRNGAVFVQIPDGEEFQVEDPRLSASLQRGAHEGHTLTLVHLERAMTDCYPISLFSIQTIRQLAKELEREIDPLRFRANIYADLAAGEDAYLGRKLRIGSTAVIEILERDERCKMITLDPHTAQADPAIIRQVTRAHGGCAGVYGKVVVEGTVNRDDEIVLAD